MEIKSVDPKSDVHTKYEFGLSPDVFELGLDSYKNIYYRRAFEDKTFSMWTSATGMSYFLAKEILERDGNDLRQEPQYRRP